MSDKKQKGFAEGAFLADRRYQIVREVNRGGNAIVYEAVDTAHGKYKPVALKCHDLRDADPRALDRLKREILNAKDVAHDNVVKLLNVVLEGECLFLVLELIRGCDLLEVINRAGGRLKEAVAHHYFVQLLGGVKQLHRTNLCHRDLKPENCMVEEATGLLKVIDLGLSKHLTSAQTLGVGTPDYMAPELINFTHPLHMAGEGAQYDAMAADVWSMGATLYLMIVGVYPFEDPANPRDITSTLRNVLQGNYRPFPGDMQGSPCCDLLARMLVPQPQNRITLEDVCKHPWVTGHGKTNQ
mmetsp:Transcript_7891/g.20208  ORF Transcript_7891/g.20208 Transcript_7891/m.20208 type:complete len:298 (+) Transcript_7891:632-1525(+)